MKKTLVCIFIFTILMGMMTVTGFTHHNDDDGIKSPSQWVTASNVNNTGLIAKIKSVWDKGEAYFREKIKQFSDMGSNWADITVGKLVELGVIAGYDDNTFKPDNRITRAEFAKVVRTALKIELTEGNAFEDTAKHWAKNEIHTLVVNNGIDKEEYGVNFEPDKNINRIEMAKIVVNSLGLKEQAQAQAGVKTLFADDSDIPSSGKGYILIASEHKIINGYPDKTFKPYGEATRAEASQMIVNMFEALDTMDTETPETEEEDFIEPELYIYDVKKGPDRNRWFTVRVRNYLEYKDQGYESKVECLNYPQLNSYTTFNSDGTHSIQIRNEFNDACSFGWFRLNKYYYSTIEQMETFKLKAGMTIQLRFTLKKGNVEKTYDVEYTLKD